MRSRARGSGFLVAAVGTALALGLGTASASAAGQGAAAVPCSSGLVCLVSTDGLTRVSVAEGATASFLPR